MSPQVSSSSHLKACYLMITFTKVAKGLPVLSPIHEDDEVVLYGNSVPTTKLVGGVVINKKSGNNVI